MSSGQWGKGNWEDKGSYGTGASGGWTGNNWSSNDKSGGWANDNRGSKDTYSQSWEDKREWKDNTSGGWKKESTYGDSSWKSDKWGQDKSWKKDDWKTDKWSKGGDWSSGGRGGYSGGGQKYGSSSMQLYAVDFSAIKLVDFVKDFYVPTESVRRRSEEECEEIRRANDISIIGGENVPKVIVSFEESSFPEYVVRSLYRQFGPNARPTPIQMQGWPIALSGRSVVGIAQTGSGKTLAYILPAVVHINAQAPAEPREGPIALVLVPTRELCTQIAQEAEKFSQAVIDVGGIPTKIAVAFGGVKKNEQVWALRESLDVLVASPGRLMDFLNCGETSLHRTTYLVLDEADQMFDMGFEPQLRQILSQIRPDRQTLMWSATWPREVRNLAKSICVDQPVHIQIGSEELTANHQIHQVAELVTGEKEKMDKLFSLVLPQLYLTDAGERIEDAKMLIFCNTKDTVDYLTKKMREEGVNAVAIHSGKEQKERLWVFDQFRTGETKVLVATNLMGRGVDVPKVNIVLNYDMPKKIEEYIHRIGRTARAGAVGKAISFVSYGDSGVIPDLIGVMNEATQDVPDWLVQMHRNPYYRAI